MDVRRQYLAIAVCAFAASAGCGSNSSGPVAPISGGTLPFATAAPTGTPTTTPTSPPTTTPTATATPTAAASPTATPVGTAGNVVVSPPALSLLGTGSAFAASVTVTQKNGTTGFAFSTGAAGGPNSCAAVASETPGAAAGSFTITPTGNGHCLFTVTGQNGRTATLTVDVTSSTVGGQ